MRSSPTPVLALAVLAACAARDPGTARTPTALDSLISVEREFAGASVRNGPRQAFLRYFDDSVVTFDPAPVIGTAALQAGAEFWPLEWEPEIAEVSAAGDLGYTSGPYRASRTDGSAAWGHYHTVWRRGPDRAWRVVLDMGCPHGEPTPVGAVGRPGTSTGSARLAGHPTTTELLARDRAYQAAYGRMGRHTALAAFAAERLRACRYGQLPFRGRAAADSEQAARHEVLAWRPAGGGVAASGDLGYTYGTGEIMRDDLEGGQRVVSYSRIWRRDATGAWRMVLETVLPYPPD
jgi:ketosteroid isomerase-like protein